jgi:hypothetical protein
MNTSRLSNSIAMAADFLDEKQLYNGEFRSYRADNEAMDEGNTLVDGCTFVTTCILYSLRFLDNPELSAMKRTALRFLIDEMKPPGIWKYFSSKYPIHIQPDLDDTALASFVVKDWHADIRAGHNVDIILRNRNKNGLFLTWLRGANYPDDVDSVVNANVLLHLGERKETSAVADFLNTIVVEHRERETYYYYLDDLAFYYAVSRAYFNGVARLEVTKSPATSRILQRQRRDGSFGSELLTALAVCSLLNYSFSDLALLSLGVESLMDTQQSDGSWPRRAYYAGPIPPMPYAAWYGSEELTTGFCLEALVRYHAFMVQNDR